MSRRRRGSMPGDPLGICLIDKPAGCTSHDVVARVRSKLNTPRVGHAGTLDPMATGVLVLGVGAATKLLTFITGVSKLYSATIRFGIETDTLDADGEITATHDMSQLSPTDVTEAAKRLTGDIVQIPPMVSAIRVGGRRLHELAREGIEVERKGRSVTVSRFDLSPTEDPLQWDATVGCSSGTYVRTLAADLGEALGGGAHLSRLQRTEVGPFSIGECHPPEDLVLLPPVEGLRHLQQVVLDESVVSDVRHGRVLESSVLGVGGSGPWAVLGPDSQLLAVYEQFRGTAVKPAIVLSTQVAG